MAESRINNHAAFIWSVADLLRGDYKQSEYGKVIRPLTVLRRLDRVLEPTKQAVLTRAAKLRGQVDNLEPVLCAVAGQRFYNTSPLDFPRLPDDPAQAVGNLRAYIAGFSSGAREVLDKFDFDTQVTRLARADLLYGTIPWRAGIYPWELLAGPVPPRDPGFLPLRLFELKNGATLQQREAFEAIREQFERLAPGRAFDVTFAAARMPVATTAPVGAGQVAVAGGDNEGGDEGQPGSIITVIGWNTTDDPTPRRERPIQLFGAGTWEALVLAEALVSAPDRLTVLDEPGVSLHPTWQTALRQALRTVPGQVLLVTHSPHLVPMEEAGHLTRLLRISNDGGGSRCRLLPRALDAGDVAKITQEFALSADARSLLFSRGAVIVSGPTEQGALPIWCAKSKAAEELGAPAARDIGFYSAPGDSGFRTVLSVLHGFGIPWVVVCDGKSFDVETNWRDHIFRQIEQAGIDFPELKRFTDRAGNGGKDTRRMTQALWDEQVELGTRHGVLTLTTGWTGSAEAVEGFIEAAAPGKLAEAKVEVGRSNIRRGRWVAQQTDCPSEVDDLYRQIVVTLDRALIDAPGSGESPSQPDGTVAR